MHPAPPSKIYIAPPPKKLHFPRPHKNICKGLSPLLEPLRYAFFEGVSLLQGQRKSGVSQVGLTTLASWIDRSLCDCLTWTGECPDRFPYQVARCWRCQAPFAALNPLSRIRSAFCAHYVWVQSCCLFRCGATVEAICEAPRRVKRGRSAPSWF